MHLHRGCCFLCFKLRSNTFLVYHYCCLCEQATLHSPKNTLIIIQYTHEHVIKASLNGPTVCCNFLAGDEIVTVVRFSLIMLDGKQQRW